jgi:pyruvate/2-oxoglutarate dehydrogenase complex dihydrolipoamide acyltransferase (E2) component
MRKIIAKRLVFSKTTVPHSYVKSVCHVDKLLRLRADLMKNEQKKVSLNDFIIKALALALRIVPELNSNYDEKTDSFTPLAGVDVSIAVATDKGLITPIVKDADRLGVLDISSRVKELAGRARANKLQPHEFQGGGFSISNLGMFGITDFTAVINPPQVGILAVGTSKRKLNVEDLTGAPVTEVSFNLSFDERCVSMDRAIKFLNTLSYFIANPDLLADEFEQF